MVSVKKSVSLKPDGRDLEVADYWYCGFLESTVTILTTQVFVFGMWIEIRWLFH